MNEPQKWPILHILVGIPIVLTIAFIIGAALDGWNASRTALLYGATMTTPVGMAYTFLVTLFERSYYVVFWAREKIRAEMKQARDLARAEGAAEGRAEGEAEGVTLGVAQGRAKSHAEWRAWYERMQAAQREGRPFDEPPPPPPENRNGS